MTDPASRPARSRAPLFLALGGCGVLGLLLVGGLAASTLEAPGPGEVAAQPAAPAGPDAPGSPPAPPSPGGQPIPPTDQWQKTVTVAELAGEWRTGAAMMTDHVTPSGEYRRSSADFYSVTYQLNADLTWASSFLGSNDRRVTREKETGTWALEGSKLVLVSSTGHRVGYWFLGFLPNPGGEAKLLLLGDQYEVTDGAMLYREVWGRAPK